MKFKIEDRKMAFVLSGILVGAIASLACRSVADEQQAVSDGAKPQTSGIAARPTNPLDAQRAYGYLQGICAIGPRPSGSPGMEKQQALLKDFFEKAGGKVSFQRFRASNPLGGDPVPMANILVEWHPERKERILLCAHYDTRPLPDRDPDATQRQTGAFIGANDGASGAAVLMELSQLVKNLEGPLGVDFLLLDGEELVYVDGRDPYFLGSTWFAKQYAEKPPQYNYRWGVVLDMVGEANLSIFQDRFSATWQETRPMVKAIWATAGRLGVKEFIPRIGYQIQDDHLPLRNTAKIPTCDLIDFVDSSGMSPPGYWHTTQDNPQHCAGSSLAKVGWVVYEWMRAEESAARGRAAAKPQASSDGTTSGKTNP